MGDKGNKGSASWRKGNLGIITILLLSLILRLIYLNQSLWLDEGIEWWAVTTFNLKDLLFGFMSGDFNPPAHYLLMWFWVRVFGTGEMAMRLPSVLLGVGTIWFVYKIGRIVGGGNKGSRGDRGNTGLLAAALAAVNGLLIYYSQEARAYMMAAFLVTGAMYYLIKEKKLGKLGNLGYLGYLVFMVMAMYSHYLTWLLLPFLVIFGIQYLLPLVFTIPWWPIVWKQLQVGQMVSQNMVWAKIGETNWQNISLAMVKFITGRVPWPEIWWWQIGVGIIVIGFWLLVGMGAIGVFRGFRGFRGFRNSKTILMTWGFGPLILGGLIGMKIPIFIYFRFIFVLPALIILAAKGLSGMKGRWGGLGKLGIIGVFGVFSFLYLFNQNYHRENWKGVIVELHGMDNRPTVIMNLVGKPAFDYYDRGRSKLVAAGTVKTAVLEDKVWYIPYAQPIFQPNDEVRKSLIGGGYTIIYEKHFNGVTLEEWKR